ncbi:MAG: endolytic transglycosylase MltG [Deltaproteobacteria bacterium]|nr:endolytic transglycosylase MltG [Deltaproteobacteria bacterium]
MLVRLLAILGQIVPYLASFLLGIVIITIIIFNAFSPVSKTPNEPTMLFAVLEGDDLRKIAIRMEDSQLIRRWWALYYLARMKGDTIETQLRKIPAGEYQISSSMTPARILETLLSGNVIYYTFTIPEGANIKEIAAIVEKSTLATAAEILKGATTSSTIQNLGILSSSLEGYLFPDTYKFTKPITSEKILQRLVDRTKAKLTPEVRKRAADLNLSINQLLTLASIVEKETADPKERPLIASVFSNRLRLAMPLQSDPTVIYGIPDFNGNLTKLHLKTPNPYNTYLTKGLPPTPICNPGLEAIEAVLNPSESEFLYFVAKNDSTHHFSTSYKEHREAVNRYQKERADVENELAPKQQMNIDALLPPPPTKIEEAPKQKPKPKKITFGQLDFPTLGHDEANRENVSQDKVNQILGQ